MKEKLTIHEELIITIYKNESTFISLTDIARSKSDDPNAVILNWLTNKNTIEFLGLWEAINNPQFNEEEFEKLKNKAGSNTFTLSPNLWVEATNAIGISIQDKNGSEVLAIEDIALEFAYWLDPTFRLYIIKEFQQLNIERNP